MGEQDVLREIADLLARPKSRTEMTAEILREIAVLLLVFAPLEALFSPDPVPWWDVVMPIALAVCSVYLGIRIEERRS